MKQVLDKVKIDGLLPTIHSVFNKLGEPIPLGYCNVGNVGKVVAVGEGGMYERHGSKPGREHGQHHYPAKNGEWIYRGDQLFLKRF